MSNNPSRIVHLNLRYYLLRNFYNPGIFLFLDRATYIARFSSIFATEYDVSTSYLDIIKALKKAFLE